MGFKPKYLFQLLTLISTFVLVACNGAEEKLFFKNIGDPDLFQNDVSPEADKNTVDIEVRSSEELLINTLQPNLFLQQYIPLYKYIDLNGIEDFAQGGGVYEIPCSSSGSVTVSSDIVPGESISSDDTVDVAFTDCVDGDYSYSGKIAYRYKGIESLNDKFIPIDTEHCVSRARTDYEVAADDVVYFNSDSLKVEPFGEETRLQFIDLVPLSESSDIKVKEIKDTLIVSQKRPYILIRQPNETNTEAITSMEGGDTVYRLENLDLDELNCQLFSREVEATVSNLMTNIPNLSLLLDGTLTLYEVSSDLDSVTHAIRNSSFNITINEGTAERVFHFNEYGAEYIDSETKDGYQFTISGAVQSTAFQYFDEDGNSSGGSTVVLNNLSELKGVDFNYPSSGELEILGRGLERLIINVTGEEIGLFIDWDGFERILGRSETDFTFVTSWDQLTERDFVFSDFVVEE